MLLMCSWIDDYLIVGNRADVLTAKKEFADVFECEDDGEMKEYIGCKITRTDDSMVITQPVLVQSLKDEFELPGSNPVTPLPAGLVYQKGNQDELITPGQQKILRPAVGKLIHMTRWSRPMELNPVREVSRLVQGATRPQYDGVHRIMQYIVNTPERGWKLEPGRKWDGKTKNFYFRILGKADETYASCPDTRKSTTGGSVFLEGAPIICVSQGQKQVSLSVTDSSLYSVVVVAQYMLYAMHFIEALEMTVEKPMELYMDNKGCFDLINNWSVAGRTRHVDSRKNFMRELKENKIIVPKWMAGENLSADLFTKNLGGPDFRRHGKEYVGHDKYM